MNWRELSPYAIESNAGYRVTRSNTPRGKVFSCWRMLKRLASGGRESAWEAFAYCDSEEEARQLCINDHEKRKR